jgi:hypothetical protein
MGGKVKELFSAVSLDEVDSIEMKKLVAGKVVTVTVRGVPVTLEANADANAGGLIDVLNQAKAAG